jgi:hypothetical protein
MGRFSCHCDRRPPQGRIHEFLKFEGFSSLFNMVNVFFGSLLGSLPVNGIEIGWYAFGASHVDVDKAVLDVVVVIDTNLVTSFCDLLVHLLIRL